MSDYRVMVYKDSSDEWRWTTVAANGERVSASTEGYKNRGHAIDQAKALNPGIALRVEGEDE